MKRNLLIGALAITAIACAQEPSKPEEPSAATPAVSSRVIVDPAKGKGKHLFILSGQSNMAGIKPEAHFIPMVAKEFGEGNVTVVKSAKSGRAISSWYSKKKGKGPLYAELVKAVEEATEGKTYETATFVWMQGESDCGVKKEDVPAQYAGKFNELIKLLKADLNIGTMNIVIGRVSDYRLTEPWQQMREVQVELANQHQGAWVDTDDLNDKPREDGTTKNDLHYTGPGREILAKRFAEKAIELIKKPSTQQ